MRTMAAPLDLLILGGTGFIGPYQVRYAVSRGHRVTVFNRGRRQADLPRGVIQLQGDREGQLDSLRGKMWDAVIDNSATNPAWVKMSAELLRDAVGRYLFVSSTGVFLPYLTRPIDESVQPRLTDNDAGDTKTYGVQKALSERETMRVFGDRAVVVRPHYIVGAGDTSDRFPYWPVRIARGGEILVPGDRTDPVQLIDVRDLTEWMVRLLEDGRSGIYNASGPRATLPMEQFVYGVAAAIRSDVTWTWIDDYDFLAAQKLTYAVPWVMPRGDTYGMSYIDSRKAIAAGLTYRSLADTTRATLDWWPTVPEARRTAPRFVLTPEREAEIIAAWKARRGSGG
jgi:nucleoside-diphosphate-sugar epimerase